MIKLSLLFCMIISLFCIINTQHFVLISAPGSGKGTFSQYMVKKYNYIQICPGDIFRDEILKQTSLGKVIQPIVEAGNYINEDIVCSLIQQNLELALREQKQFIIDGFPRSHNSLNFLIEFLTKNQILNQTCFLQLQASDEICKQRVLTRFVCTACHHVDNATMINSKNSTFCKSCGNQLTPRLGDSESVIHKRLEYFHKEIEPIINDLQQLPAINIKQLNAAQELSALEGIYDELVR